MNSSLVKKHGIPAILALIAGGCFSAFHLIGSRVAADGMLEEPFALLPIGYLSLFMALAFWVAMGIRGLARHQSAGA